MTTRAQTLASVVDRVSFAGLMGVAKWKAWVEEDALGVWLHQAFTVPDTSKSTLGESLEVSTRTGLPNVVDVNDENQASEFIRRTLLDAWTHEFRESLLLDGRWLKSPHPGADDGR